MIACGQNKLNKLWKLEESHLDSVDPLSASDHFEKASRASAAKKLATGQHTCSIFPPLPGLQKAISHGPAAFGLGSGQEHFPPKLAAEVRARDSTYQGWEIGLVCSSLISLLCLCLWEGTTLSYWAWDKSKYLKMAVVWPRKWEKMCCCTILDEVFP